MTDQSERVLAQEVVREHFFFQAEDGIRDYKVTGVQTCALPICGLTNTWNCMIPGGIAATITNHYAFRIAPSAIVSATNKATGTGGNAYISASRMVWE